MVPKRIRSLVKKIDKRLLNGYFRKRVALRRRFPYAVSIDTTGRCNLRCVMCCWHERLTVKNAIMPDEVLDRIVPILPNIAHISLQCNSEPLLNKKLSRIISRFKSTNAGVYISLVTNGMLLSIPRADELIACGLDELGISIDGASSETFNALRRGADFKEVVANIEALNQRKTEKGSRTPAIRIVTVASTTNVSELAGILELAARLGASAMSVNGLEAYTEETNGKQLYRMNPDESHAAVFERLRRRAEELGITIHLPSLRMLPYSSCLLNTPVIDPDGNVYPCPELSYERPYFYNGRVLVHPRISLGSVVDTPFEEIWNSPESRELRERLVRGEFPIFCRSCLMMHSVLCALGEV